MQDKTCHRCGTSSASHVFIEMEDGEYECAACWIKLQNKLEGMNVAAHLRADKKRVEKTKKQTRRTDEL